MHKSRNIFLALTAPLLGVWCFASWLIADAHYNSSTQALIEHETSVLEKQADDLADSLRRNLHFLDGIPSMAAHLVRVRAAVSRFGPNSHPSDLPLEKRKKTWTQDPSLNDLSQYLSVIQTNLGVDIVYVINAAGDCIAASNWDKPESLIGNNFIEREYFQASKAGQPGVQYAVGKATKIPGLFFSSPILVEGQIMGSMVTKIDIQNLAYITNQLDAYITDQYGVIILAHDKQFEMHAMPGGSVLGMPEQKKIERYRRPDFPVFPITPWGDLDFPSLKHLAGEEIPHMLTSRELPEFRLTAYIENEQAQLPALKRERLWIFLLLAFFGTGLILSAAGILIYLRSVKKSQQALQASEAELKAIIEAIPVPLALNDEQGNIAYLNRAFIQLIGYTRDDIPTLEDWWPLAYPDPQYRQWVAESWQDNMDKAKRDNLPFSPMEINVRCKDGLERIFMIGVSAIKGGFAGTHLVMLYDITERKASELEINSLAFYDPLTRLPNRRLLGDRLKQALATSARNERHGALLFIDLDNFKTLNDTLGHDIGDQLLKQVAQRLTACLRESETVARQGGDEFVVMLEELSDQVLLAAAQAESVGEKILASLSQPYQLGTHEYRSTASIGANLFKAHLQPMEELLKQADIAMYQAKRAGRNTLRFFDPGMQDTINTRASLEIELRKAHGEGDFQLYYQVQVDSSNRPFGAEALIRWMHAERGMVSPAQFIPMLEETGLILPVGLWVLETACTQLKAWQQDESSRDLVLAINVSAKQFHQSDFVAQVQAAVQRHDINPAKLKLELTESLLLDNIEETIATMNRLNDIGIQLSLDDFGTGYSSLQYLKRLPLDQLKIDQSFVRDITTDNNDNAIMRTIIAMAGSMNLSVIAEGVETEAQRQLLLENGCMHYQGYLFGKPVPIEQFDAKLKKS